MTTLYTNNFDAETVGALPAGWVNKVGAFTVSTTKPVSAPNSFGSVADGNAALYTGIAAVADMEVLSDHIAFPIGTNLVSPGHVLRSDAAYANLYLVSMAGTGGNTYQIYLYKMVGGSFTLMSGPIASGLTVVAGDTVHLASSIIGTTLSCYVWKNATAKPGTPTASVTDSSITAAGYAGLRISGDAANSTIVTCDNFFINDTAVGATAVTLTGPTAGVSGTPSTNFTVGANGAITGTVIVTPSDSAGGGTFTPTTVSISSGTPTGTFTYTPASAGAKTISVTNNGSLTNPSSITYTASAAANNALTSATRNVLFSPYNWNIGASTAKTINSGAYFRVLFGGATCTLQFDMTGLIAPFPQVSYRVNAFGAWNTVTLSASVPITIPAPTTGCADKPGHFLEFVVKSTTQTQNRWTTQATGVNLTGIILDTGKALSKPPARSLVGLYYGDSVTEGTRTANAGATDTDWGDGAASAAHLSGLNLGAEIGIVGFGAMGWITGNTTMAIPAFTSSYNFIYSGVARSFATSLDFICINMGTNDAGADVTTATTTVLNGLLAAVASTTKIIVLRPYNGSSATTIQAGIVACSAPSRINYVDTTGWFNTANSSDGLHPYGAENLFHTAPLLTASIKSVLAGVPTLTARTVTFTLGDTTGVLANLTGLKISFYDEPTPDLHTVPRYKTAVGTSNASGVVSFSVNSTLASGGSGSVIVQTASGQHFNGSVVVA